jgi:hypothetical protein
MSERGLRDAINEPRRAKRRDERGAAPDQAR